MERKSFFKAFLGLIISPKIIKEISVKEPPRPDTKPTITIRPDGPIKVYGVIHIPGYEHYYHNSEYENDDFE